MSELHNAVVDLSAAVVDQSLPMRVSRQSETVAHEEQEVLRPGYGYVHASLVDQESKRTFHLR